MHKDGSTFQTMMTITLLKDSNQRPIGIAGTTHDITERKQAEVNLQRQQKEQQIMMDSISGWIFYKDKQNRFIQVNKAMTEVMGMTKEQMEGKSCFDLYPKKQAELYWKNDKEVIASGKPKMTMLEFMKTPKGNLWVQTDKTPYLDAQGNVIGIIGFAIDITERKQMEDALRVSLQEKNVLIREIHHRVKNNMQVISSLLQLQSDQINDDSIRLLFKEAKDRIRSMSLVHEKLYSTEHMDTIDLAFFINDLVTNLFRSYGINNNRIQFTLEGKNVTLGIDDAVPLALILNELISNSLKHAFPSERKGKINIRIEEKQGIITIELADNGIGTPANVQINNTKTLGLKIVQALTEQINGSIELARNSGTRFILSFKKK